MPRPTDTRQGSLAGFAAPHSTDRLFFAVMPPAPMAERMASLTLDLRVRLALRGKPRPTLHLHVTLHHLGDFAGVPPQLVENAREAAAGVAAAPFETRFNRAGSFAGRAGRHPFVLLGDNDSMGLSNLQSTLGARLAAAGLTRRERPFVPHLTLLYDTRTVPLQSIETIGWPVREFLLVHSLLGRSQYRLLGRWPLTANGATA